MQKKRQWWTVQLVPHGKGEVQSYRIQFLPIVLGISFALTLLLVILGLCVYLWSANDSLLDDMDTLQQIETENIELKTKVHQLTNQLTDLHTEVGDLQEWLKEVELLEQELRNPDDTSSILLPSIDDGGKASFARIAHYSPEKEFDIDETFDYIEQLKEKINRVKSSAEMQHRNLADLKEQLEEEMMLALYIPSIPPSNGRISSSFGWRKDPLHGKKRLHQGIDFVDYHKAPIYATASGTVVAAEKNSGYGNQIIIDHGNGYITTYSHLTSFSVEKGDLVTKGDVIGQMGSTGRSTGVHLHYEIHKDGNVINPISYVKGEKPLVGKETANR